MTQSSSPNGRSRDVLAHIAAQGGRTRNHRYFGELGAFVLPVIVATLIQCLIYAGLFLQHGRADWDNYALAAISFVVVPVMTGLTLTAFRRHESPLTSAIAIGLVYFSFAVATLSALRIPVSYTGLAICLPVLLVAMAYGNVWFHRGTRSRIAIADYSGAEALNAMLGCPGRIVPPEEVALADVDILVIDPETHYAENWAQLLARCYLGHIEIVPWTEVVEARLGRVDVGSFEIHHVVYSPSQIAYAALKRYFDIAAVLVTLPLTLVLGLVAAGYILLRDGRPILFIQERRGFAGQSFRMLKLRTMYKGQAGGTTGARDRRIIPGCGILRKLRLDELPQLLNILRGEMSLIGPRPVAEYVAEASESAEPKYAYRTLVLPGITGWAQVKSGYAATVDEELVKLSYDLFYIKRLSFDLDTQILFESVRTVLFGQGAR